VDGQLKLPREYMPRIDARPEIVRLKAAGYSNRIIAEALNTRGIPTPSGRGRWHGTTVLRHADPAAAARWARYIAQYRQLHR
jgi:hypothetical protein